jgi:hypothetical protein
MAMVHCSEKLQCKRLSSISNTFDSWLTLLTSSNSHRGLIELAAISSKLVYAGAPEALKHFSLIRFTPAGPVINLSPDALFGTIKAADIRLFNGDVNGDGHLTPFIVVAIRGTASVRDWTVNFNHGVNETVHTEFLVSLNVFYYSNIHFTDNPRVKLSTRSRTKFTLAFFSLLNNLAHTSRTPF